MWRMWQMWTLWTWWFLVTFPAPWILVFQLLGEYERRLSFLVRAHGDKTTFFVRLCAFACPPLWRLLFSDCFFTTFFFSFDIDGKPHRPIAKISAIRFSILRLNHHLRFFSILCGNHLFVTPRSPSSTSAPPPLVWRTNSRPASPRSIAPV